MPGIRLPLAPVRGAVRLASPLAVSASLGIGRQRLHGELMSRLLLPPLGTKVDEVELGGVRTERVTLGKVADDAALLYFHGGGYCIGSPRGHRPLVAPLAAQIGVPAYVADYRLAPEHPFPAALEDALAAYRALLDEGLKPSRIVIAGDSAGGGLSLATTMALRDAGDPLPAAVGMICPWLDVAPDHRGTRLDADEDPLFPSAAARVWARAYADGHDPEDPGLSPLRGDLGGLPPLVLHSAACDPFASDAKRLAARVEGTELRRVDGEWHVLHLLAGVLSEADDAVEAMGSSLAAHLRPVGPRVAIVGAGMSGICMGEALKQAGYEDFTIYEKADELGGTWRENRYPGLTCDVPSRFYSFSFAPNPDWTSAFSPGSEIQDYFVRTAEERGLRERMRFGTEVEEARWDDGRWRIRTAGGEESEADVLVTATGVLHHPKLPDIEGMDSFEGAAFHSARWDDSVDLHGKRVAVIGNGSTGVQLTVATAGVAGRLLLFQRTPQWIAPVPNAPSSLLERLVLRHVPGANRLAYDLHREVLEGILGEAVTHPGWQRRLLSDLCRANLRLGVREPELRAKLTPDYEPMCKRLVMSSGFYPAVQRDDVDVITEGIERIEPRGIVTSDGVLHELDVIVYATGFDPHAYMRPMNIVGEDGRTLDEAWADGPKAYRTIALPGFPNLFTLMGPHSPVGNHSLIAVAETQARYIVDWIQRMESEGLASVAPTDEATDAYYERLKAAFPGTIWVSGCQSWYLDANGVPELWPWTPGRHREMLDGVEEEHFTTRGR